MQTGGEAAYLQSAEQEMQVGDAVEDLLWETVKTTSVIQPAFVLLLSSRLVLNCLECLAKNVEKNFFSPLPFRFSWS